MAQLVREITHAHFFCGLGGGAKGFNKGRARLGNTVARFRCLGGVDSDPAAIADFNRLAGVPGTVLDLFSREQFIAFHGREPGPDWRPATTTDIQAAFGFERPNIVFLSAPCKGFSGLLAEKVSLTAKYQALNELTLRGVWLMCEAFKDDPPELIVFENVPRIATRGRPLLDQIVSLLRHYGYAVNETTHDCGRIGKLAQSRELTRRVIDLANEAASSTVVILVNDVDGARHRYAVEDRNALLNAGIAVLCAAEAQARERAATCPSCAAKAKAIGHALDVLGITADRRGAGQSIRPQAVH